MHVHDLVDTMHMGASKWPRPMQYRQLCREFEGLRDNAAFETKFNQGHI